MALRNAPYLALDRCPHCAVAKPSLGSQWRGVTEAHDGSNPRVWSTYACATCGGMVMTSAPHNVQNAQIVAIWPTPVEVSDAIPVRARDFLSQAISSINAPAGAVML